MSRTFSYGGEVVVTGNILNLAVNAANFNNTAPQSITTGAVDPSSSLTEILNETDKQVVSSIKLAGFDNSESVDIQLIVDGVTIRNSTHTTAGSGSTIVYIHGGASLGGGTAAKRDLSIAPFQVNSSIVINVQTATSTSITCTYVSVLNV